MSTVLSACCLKVQAGTMSHEGQGQSWTLRGFPRRRIKACKAYVTCAAGRGRAACDNDTYTPLSSGFRSRVFKPSERVHTVCRLGFLLNGYCYDEAVQ